MKSYDFWIDNGLALVGSPETVIRLAARPASAAWLRHLSGPAPAGGPVTRPDVEVAGAVWEGGRARLPLRSDAAGHPPVDVPGDAARQGVATVSFGDILRQHRVAAGLTQEDLAEQAGLSLRGISDLERGVRRAPHRGTVLRLAAALRLGTEETCVLLTVGRRPRTPTRVDASRTVTDDPPPRGRVTTYPSPRAV